VNKLEKKNYYSSQIEKEGNPAPGTTQLKTRECTLSLHADGYIDIYCFYDENTIEFLRITT
jgi:hypothetical protein